MDGIAFFFVIVMSVVGGLCAYVADILGYKIGKKRISFKRVRPKYVARTTVVIAGGLIPLITILIIFIASRDFRMWLTEGQKAIEGLKQARETLIQTESRNSSLSNANKILDAKIKKGEEDLLRLEGTLRNLRAKNTELFSKLQPLETKVVALGTKVSGLTAKNQQELEKNRRLQGEYKKITESLEKAKAELVVAQDKSRSVTAEFSKLSFHNLELTNKNADLEKNNSQLESNLGALQNQIETLSKGIDTLKLEKAKAEKAAEEANKAAKDAEQAYANLQSKVATLNADYVREINRGEARTRLNAITYFAEEEIGRVLIPKGLSVRDATNIYASLMRKARSSATERGAEPDPINYPFNGVVGFIMTDNGVVLTEEDTERFWVQQMTQVERNQVLIMAASTNRFAKEPVTLSFAFKPNPLVFRKGEIVAEGRIDGRWTELEIRDTIREFLRTFVNTKAKTRNMVPVHTRDGDSYGQFTEEQYFKAVAQAKAMPRVLRMVAVARDDTYAGDSLEINLEFR